MPDVETPREAVLAHTLVEVAETVVGEFDVAEMLTMLTNRYVDLLDVTTAGFMLVAPEGDLRLVASSSEAMRVVELFELQAQEGPCVDCYHTGEPLLNQHLSRAKNRWANFAPVALKAGFRSVHALPLRLHGATVGAVNLFRVDEQSIDPAEVLAAQALADMATIAIVQSRATAESQEMNEQLSYALKSRVLIEQAKGMLAQSGRLDMEDAFAKLRAYARNHNLQLIEVSRNVIDRDLDLATLEKNGIA